LGRSWSVVVDLGVVGLGGLLQGCCETVVYSARTLLLWRWFAAGRAWAWSRPEARHLPVARALHCKSNCLTDSLFGFVDVWFFA